MSYTQRLIERETALGRPVRVGIVGAGQMGSGLVAQVHRARGMEVVAVADIAVELASLRLVVWKAASRLDRGEDASAEIAQARSLVSRHATWIGSSGVQLLGGHGFVKEFDNERWYRDLRGAGVLEGTLLV